MLETLTMFPLLTLRWGIASWLSLSALFRLIWGQIVWHNIENTDWHTTTQRSGLIVISNIATQWATDWHTRTDRVPRLGLIVVSNIGTNWAHRSAQTESLDHVDSDCRPAYSCPPPPCWPRENQGTEEFQRCSRERPSLSKIGFYKNKTENLPPRCDTVSLIACTQACKKSEQHL